MCSLEGCLLSHFEKRRLFKRSAQSTIQKSISIVFCVSGIRHDSVTQQDRKQKQSPPGNTQNGTRPGGVTGSVYCTTDDRSYQMSHWVSIPMIFVSAIFASLSRQMTRATLTAKMALTAKMRDCSRFIAWITLTAKMAANACS